MSLASGVARRLCKTHVSVKHLPGIHGRNLARQHVMWKAVWPSTRLDSFMCFGSLAVSKGGCFLQKKLWQTSMLLVKHNHASFVRVHGRCFSAKPAVEEHSEFVEKGSSDVDSSPQKCTHKGLSSDSCSGTNCSSPKGSKHVLNSVKDPAIEPFLDKAASSFKPIQDSAAVQQGGVQHNSNVSDAATEAAAVKKPGLLKRFKMMYKQYGIIMFCVHWSTASVWTAMFYYAAISGVDVVPLLKWMGASDAVIKPFLLPSVGHAAVTYLMYKLATPARYTVTLAGTQLAVKYLRKWGYLKEPPVDDSLRSLVSDSRTIVKDKMGEVRDKVEVVRDKVEDRFDDIRDEMHELKDKFNDKIDIVRDKVEDRIDDLRDEMKGKLNNIRVHIGDNRINRTVKQHKM